MLRLYKMSDSTVFKQKDTGLGTSLRYFRAPEFSWLFILIPQNAFLVIHI